MKHAYLIIAHNEPNILKTLLLMLDDERNDVYLHVDARAVQRFSVEERKVDNLEKSYSGTLG